MSHKIIMPVLGMAQETGRLVVWNKAVGDKISADDILMEVETDKSVMEVEAGFDGFIGELLVAEGNDVPVGDVVAYIVDTQEEVGANATPPAPRQAAEIVAPEQASPPPTAVPNVTVPDVVPPTAAATLTTPATPVAPTGTSRIFASPKARRLAKEQGLDLGLLVSAGVSQPFHVADLETLKTLKPEPLLSAQAVQSVQVVRSHITARVPKSGFVEFAAFLEAGYDTPISNASVWAAFAAGSLRAAKNMPVDQSDIDIGVRVVRPMAELQADYLNPDRTRLSELTPQPFDRPDLMLHDLTQSRILSVQLGNQICPVLTIGQAEDNYELALSFVDDELSAEQAMAFIVGFAGRMEQALRHML